MCRKSLFLTQLLIFNWESNVSLSFQFTRSCYASNQLCTFMCVCACVHECISFSLALIKRIVDAALWNFEWKSIAHVYVQRLWHFHAAHTCMWEPHRQYLYKTVKTNVIWNWCVAKRIEATTYVNIIQICVWRYTH